MYANFGVEINIIFHEIVWLSTSTEPYGLLAKPPGCTFNLLISFQLEELWVSTSG